MFYLVHTPWWLKKLYPQCTWDIPVKDKTIFLTFDDGPHPEVTPFVLSQLKQFGFRATFFCIGKNVKACPHIFEAVKMAGHTVGNHTMHHVNGWKTRDDIYMQEMKDADSLIESQFFRPPYGRIKKSQASLLKTVQPSIKIIMWNILSGDFDTSIDGEKCFRNVIKYIKPGGIIVFHDSVKAFPRLQVALPKVLEWLKENDYRSVGL